MPVNRLNPGIDDVSQEWISNTLPFFPLKLPHSNDKLADLTLFNTLVTEGASINGSRILDRENLCIVPLMAAILAEKVDVVNAVLGLEPVTDLRASPYGRPTPLQLAARLGNSKIFNILIEHRANVNAEAFPIAGHTALQAAIPGKHTSVAEGIIFNGADISAPLAKSNGLSTLRAAVIRGYLPFWNRSCRWARTRMNLRQMSVIGRLWSWRLTMEGWILCSCC